MNWWMLCVLVLNEHNEPFWDYQRQNATIASTIIHCPDSHAAAARTISTHVICITPPRRQTREKKKRSLLVNHCHERRDWQLINSVLGGRTASRTNCIFWRFKLNRCSIGMEWIEYAIASDSLFMLYKTLWTVLWIHLCCVVWHVMCIFGMLIELNS